MNKNYYILWGFALTMMLVSCSGEESRKTDEAESSPLSGTPAQKPTVPQPTNYEAGKAAYISNCAACHMPNGQGVPGLNPPLRGTDYVKGDKSRLIGIILNGLNEEIVINGEVYNNQMASLGHLPDSTIADILTFVRFEFGEHSSAITAKEVIQERG